MSTGPDPFEFVKQLWGQMAVPGFGLTAGSGTASGMPGLQMPSFDPKELEQRLAQLKQVKQWLEMNLNMMSLQINTIEMQLAGMAGMAGLKAASTKAFGDQSTQSVGGSASAGSAAGHAAPGAAGASGASGASGAPGAAWMDPQAWMKFMQDQATKTQKAMQDGAQAMQKAAQSTTAPARATGASNAAADAPKRAPRKKKA